MDFFFWFQLQTHKYNGHLIIIDIIKMTKKEKKTEKYYHSDDRCLTTTTKTTTIKMDSLCVYKYKNDDRIGLIVDIRKKIPKERKKYR